MSSETETANEFALVERLAKSGDALAILYEFTLMHSMITRLRSETAALTTRAENAERALAEAVDLLRHADDEAP